MPSLRRLTLNPDAAPARVLAGKSQDERTEFGIDRRPTRLSLRRRRAAPMPHHRRTGEPLIASLSSTGGRVGAPIRASLIVPLRHVSSRHLSSIKLDTVTVDSVVQRRVANGVPSSLRRIDALVTRTKRTVKRLPPRTSLPSSEATGGIARDSKDKNPHEADQSEAKVRSSSSKLIARDHAWRFVLARHLLPLGLGARPYIVPLRPDVTRRSALQYRSTRASTLSRPARSNESNPARDWQDHADDAEPRSKSKKLLHAYVVH